MVTAVKTNTPTHKQNNKTQQNSKLVSNYPKLNQNPQNFAEHFEILCLFKIKRL